MGLPHIIIFICAVSMEALMSIFTLSYLFVRDASHTLVCVVGLLSRNIVFGV